MTRTHCKHGHPLSGENLHIRPDGSRRCLTCHRAQKRKYRAADYVPLKERPWTCGHDKSERTRLNTCRACSAENKRAYNKRYWTKYQRPQQPAASRPVTGTSSRQMRAVAKHQAQAVFWRRKAGLTLMGRLIEEQTQRVVYLNEYGIEGRLPKVDGWLVILPAADVPGLPPLPVAG